MFFKCSFSFLKEYDARSWTAPFEERVEFESRHERHSNEPSPIAEVVGRGLLPFSIRNRQTDRRQA